MKYYTCPNCKGEIMKGYNSCPNCGTEIVIINDTICPKSLYESLPDVLNSLDKVEREAIESKEYIEENINNPEHYNTLKNNQELKNEQITRTLDVKKNSEDLSQVLKSMLDSPSELNILKSLEPIFGESETKIRHTYSILTELLTLIDKYLDKIESDENTENNNNKTTTINNERILDI